MKLLKFCIVIVIVYFSCKTITAQVKEKTQSQTFVRTKPTPFIVNGNYKDSYSISFMCRIEAAVHGNILYLFKGCNKDDYSDGYEDGYNAREEKHLPAMALKVAVKAIQISAAAAVNSTSEEEFPLSSQETNFSVTEVSYKTGYSDGTKDRRKEEKEIAEAIKQGRKIIYAGQNKEFKEKYKE